MILGSITVDPKKLRSRRYNMRRSSSTIGPAIAPEHTYRPPRSKQSISARQFGPPTISATTEMLSSTNNSARFSGARCNIRSAPRSATAFSVWSVSRILHHQSSLDNILGKYFGVDGIPTLVLVDKDGNIINRYVGYSPGKEEDYIKDLENYYNERGVKHNPISLKEETIDFDDQDISIEF